MNNQLLLNLTHDLALQQRRLNPSPDGIYPTACAQVDVCYRTIEQYQQPTLYTPGLIFLFSGQKTIQLGTNHYVYHRGKGLLLPGCYPVRCHEQASQDEPLIGIIIQLERGQVAQLLQQIEQISSEKAQYLAKLASSISASASHHQGIMTFTITPDIQSALHYLLECLQDKITAQLFAPTQIQVLTYALLQQAVVFNFFQGWIKQDGRYAQFLKAMDYIQTHLTTTLTVTSIAAEVGLSVPSLNRTFKHYTADTPMQYVKKLRLNQAYRQLTQTACSIQTAAYAVGYESVSQFSREFKRYYGHSPKQQRLGMIQ